MKTRGWGAVALAYPAAALAGAVIVTIGFAAISTYASLANEGGWDKVGRGTWVLPAATIYAFVVYMAGLIVIGTPAWLVLSRTGRRSRRDAVVAGAVLSALAGAIFILAAGEPATAWEPWAFVASLALPGAAAGWTLHRVACGR
ncbi:hypothetical protein [Brevundimonas bacteroides]|uniref:hypothetical protein n=1 Tax=Brevundimonas bacteroides TaxID=74311 RepID=UPI000495F739|nr:hypothetical protein [Brevundimonas bacteroides]